LEEVFLSIWTNLFVSSPNDESNRDCPKDEGVPM
jgi:hypothetical protein